MPIQFCSANRRSPYTNDILLVPWFYESTVLADARGGGGVRHDDGTFNMTPSGGGRLCLTNDMNLRSTWFTCLQSHGVNMNLRSTWQYCFRCESVSVARGTCADSEKGPTLLSHTFTTKLAFQATESTFNTLHIWRTGSRDKTNTHQNLRQSVQIQNTVPHFSDKQNCETSEKKFPQKNMNTQRWTHRLEFPCSVKKFLQQNFEH